MMTGVREILNMNYKINRKQYAFKFQVKFRKKIHT